MTLQELLKSLGYTDEQINQITEAMKTNKIYTASEENLDIRYGKLKTDFDSLTNQHGEATKLIESLKKTNKDNEEMQGKFKEYEDQVKTLQAENEKLKVDNAIKISLLQAGAKDVDYMVYKLKEKGELALDENGKIKDWDNKLAELNTQFPEHFKSAKDTKIVEQKLPGGDPDPKTEPTSLADAIKAQYEKQN